MRTATVYASFVARKRLSCSVAEHVGKEVCLTIDTDDDGGCEVRIYAPSIDALAAIADAVYYFRMDLDADAMQAASPTEVKPTGKE